MTSKKLMMSLLGILSVLVCAGAYAGTDCAKEEAYPLISMSELKQVADGKSAFIVDVNSKDSFADSHVPGAIHYGSNIKKFDQMLPSDKNTLIVAYCGGPACTAWKKAAERACKMGYTNIKHFKEGIQGWKQNHS